MGALQPTRPSGSGAADVDDAIADLEAREMQTQTYPALHVVVRTPFGLNPANKAGYAARRTQLGTVWEAKAPREG